MNKRQIKVLSLTASSFLLGVTGFINYKNYKKGKIDEATFKTNALKYAITSGVNTLGIIYLEEQERKEQLKIMELRAQQIYVDPEKVTDGKILKKEHKEEKLAKQVEDMFNNLDPEVQEVLKDFQDDI